MTRIKELKENDVIIFQNITKDMKNNCQAIVNKKWSEIDQSIGEKWYASVEMMNGNETIIDDNFDFIKVKLPFTRKIDTDDWSRTSNNVPSHYEGKEGIDVIEFIRQQLTEEQFEGFMLGNIIKYAARYGLKDNKVNDLKKIGDYQQRMLEVVIND